MNNISSLFGKLFKKVSQDESDKKEILRILFEKTKYDFQKEDINIKDGIITIKAHPLIKQEININKKAILDFLQEKVSFKIIDLR